MNGPIVRGDDMPGLVRYLLGHGREEEHVNPRVIAAEAGISVALGVTPSGDEIRSLGFQMDLPRRIHGTKVTRAVELSDGTRIQQPAHVWHLVLANPAGDRLLSDKEWAGIAEDSMRRMGFAGSEGVAPCPWAAIRHGLSANGNDHIHVAVSLVREDGRKANVHNDWVKIGTACAQYERRYGLTVVEGRRGGARHDLSPAEARREVERRATAAEAPREASVKERLEQSVRAAAVAAGSEAEFVRRLRVDGIAVRPRYETGGKDAVIGYSVALRGDKPIWHGGGTLSPDLSLPSLRSRWPAGAEGDAVAEWRRDRRLVGTNAAGEGRRYGSTEWQQAADHVGALVDRLMAVPPGDPATWQAITGDAAGVLAILADRVEGPIPGSLTRAARQLAAAAHRPGVTRLSPGATADDLRGVATVVAQALLPGGPPAWLCLLGQMQRLVSAIANADDAHVQAGAARRLATEASKELNRVHQHHCALPGRRHLLGIPLQNRPIPVSAPGAPDRGMGP
ncbi:MAG TPA: hypothetical protein VFW71_07315 [Actinomycetota bacterium]|nr:hypothetical protein [Actinomycetota bacterium]